MKRILSALLAALVVASTAHAKAFPGMVYIVNVGADGELKFFPSNMQVRVQDTVIFSAESGVTSVSHVPAGSCTPSSPLFQSPQLGAPGLGVGQETFDYTFTAPGTYEFASVEHCAAGMKGSITVIASGLPEIPAEFEGATPAESVPLPDNGVITVAPTTTKKLTQQTPPPNVVAGTSPAATATATAGGNGGGAQPTTKPNSAQKLGQVAGLAGAVVAGALALL